jgi:hypothetical protein
MADQADVETALAAIVGGVLYPAGLEQGCVVLDAVCRIYRGWPTPAALDADLANGLVNVSITAVAGSHRVTTRYPDRWRVLQTVTPALTVSVVNEVASFAGAANVGQIACLLVEGRAAVHRTEAHDTPEIVAAALAAELNQLGAAPWNAALAVGATVSVPGARSVTARVTADQPALRETRRQRQNFSVACWCSQPALRDAVGSAIDSALSRIDFIGLADLSSGRLRFVDSVTSDRWQDATLYRRELTYSVDYPTTITAALPCLTVGGTMISPDGTTIANRLS